MLSLQFVLKLVTLPYAVVKTVLQYYTVGTPFSRTNVEFKNSLSKNIHLASLYHLSGNLQKQDVLLILNKPLTTFFDKWAKSPLTQGLRNYGKQNDDHSYWVVQNQTGSPEKDQVIVYVHGGGYLLKAFESQFVAMLALYHALPEESKKHTSILFIDYSTTADNHVFPTQLWECVHVYDSLVKQGYKNIHLLGDSAGVHMCCTLARYISYPEEIKKIEPLYPQFDFSFHGKLIQPKSLILLSPWMQPTTKPNYPPVSGVDPTGDLGATDTSMGDYYVGDMDEDKISNFITFTNTNYDDHWAKVEPIANGNTLIIVGEREVLREGVEKFHSIVNKHNNIPLHVEKGGIHAALVYVESLNYYGNNGAKRALEGDFKDRYAINQIVNFLEKVNAN